MSSGLVDRARLLASSSIELSKWLQVVPSLKMGLLLDNVSARIAVGLRLRNKVCETHNCICGALVYENGHHGLSCNKSYGRYRGHTDINKLFSMAFKTARLPNMLEPPGLSRRNGKRPDAITLTPWSRGKYLIWDVTVVVPTYLSLTSSFCGSAADLAERHKHNDYIDLKQKFIFTPLAFEYFGVMGPETKEFKKVLGKIMSRESGEPRSLDILHQRISIVIQLVNAYNVLNTFAEQSELNLFS